MSAMFTLFPVKTGQNVVANTQYICYFEVNAIVLLLNYE